MIGTAFDGAKERDIAETKVWDDLKQKLKLLKKLGISLKHEYWISLPLRKSRKSPQRLGTPFYTVGLEASRTKHTNEYLI